MRFNEYNKVSHFQHGLGLILGIRPNDNAKDEDMLRMFNIGNPEIVVQMRPPQEYPYVVRFKTNEVEHTYVYNDEDLSYIH